MVAVPCRAAPRSPPAVAADRRRHLLFARDAPVSMACRLADYAFIRAQLPPALLICSAAPRSAYTHAAIAQPPAISFRATPSPPDSAARPAGVHSATPVTGFRHHRPPTSGPPSRRPDRRRPSPGIASSRPVHLAIPLFAADRLPIRSTLHFRRGRFVFRWPAPPDAPSRCRLPPPMPRFAICAAARAFYWLPLAFARFPDFPAFPEFPPQPPAPPALAGQARNTGIDCCIPGCHYAGRLFILNLLGFTQ